MCWFLSIRGFSSDLYKTVHVDGPKRLLRFADGLCYAFIALLSPECLSGIFFAICLSGGSVKISLSCGWFCMRCHFLVSNVSKLGKAGLYCVTKGNILHTCITALLFNCRFSVTEFDFREVFLYNTSWVSSIQKAFLEVFHIFRGICSQKLLHW